MQDWLAVCDHLMEGVDVEGRPYRTATADELPTICMHCAETGLLCGACLNEHCAQMHGGALCVECQEPAVMLGYCAPWHIVPSNPLPIAYGDLPTAYFGDCLTLGVPTCATHGEAMRARMGAGA